MGNRIPDLPILGEPLIPEFANTLYIDQRVQFDVLDRPSWTAAWLATAPCAVGSGAPRRVATTDLHGMRVLRDATRGVLLRDPGSDPGANIAVINQAARRAHPHKTLVLRSGGELGITVESSASRLETFLAAIAQQVIHAVEHDELGLIEVCTRPDCNMFYFRDHHRRRYCNARCANADRQARYNRRMHGRTTPSRPGSSAGAPVGSAKRTVTPGVG